MVIREGVVTRERLTVVVNDVAGYDADGSGARHLEQREAM